MAENWTEPTHRDYCYGKRARRWGKWEGTRVFLGLVRKNAAAFQNNSNQRARRRVVEGIIQTMCAEHRRFFKLTEGDGMDYWVDVTDDRKELYEIVRLRLRDASKRLPSRPVFPAMRQHCTIPEEEDR